MQLKHLLLLPFPLLSAVACSGAIPVLAAASVSNGGTIRSRVSTNESPQIAALGLARAVDLNRGQSTNVVLSDGTRIRLKLIGLQEFRDSMRQAVREAY